MSLLAAATEAAEGVRPGTSAAACCVFAEAALRRKFGAAVDAVPRARWRIILDDPDVRGVGPWEPVYAARDAGIALEVREPVRNPPTPPRRRWALVQIWRGKPFAPGVEGHTFLWKQLTETHGLKVDSSETTGPQVPEQGPIAWADAVRGAVGGVAVAVLRPVAGP